MWQCGERCVRMCMHLRLEISPDRRQAVHASAHAHAHACLHLHVYARVRPPCCAGRLLQVAEPECVQSLTPKQQFCKSPVYPELAELAHIGRGDDTVGNPHRIQISQFELFEIIILSYDCNSLSSNSSRQYLNQHYPPPPS